MNTKEFKMNEVSKSMMNGDACDTCGFVFEFEGYGKPRKCSYCKERLKEDSKVVLLVIKNFLINKNYKVTESKGNNFLQIKTSEGLVVNVYQTCSVVIQGDCSNELRKGIIDEAEKVAYIPNSDKQKKKRLGDPSNRLMPKNTSKSYGMENILDFGKHKLTLVKNIPKSYLIWAYYNVYFVNFTDEVLKYLDIHCATIKKPGVNRSVGESILSIKNNTISKKQKV